MMMIRVLIFGQSDTYLARIKIIRCIFIYIISILHEIQVIGFRVHQSYTKEQLV